VVQRLKRPAGAHRRVADRVGRLRARPERDANLRGDLLRLRELHDQEALRGAGRTGDAGVRVEREHPPVVGRAARQIAIGGEVGFGRSFRLGAAADDRREARIAGDFEAIGDRAGAAGPGGVGGAQDGTRAALGGLSTITRR